MPLTLVDKQHTIQRKGETAALTECPFSSSLSAQWGPGRGLAAWSFLFFHPVIYNPINMLFKYVAAIESELPHKQPWSNPSLSNCLTDPHPEGCGSPPVYNFTLNHHVLWFFFPVHTTLTPSSVDDYGRA